MLSLALCFCHIIIFIFGHRIPTFVLLFNAGIVIKLLVGVKGASFARYGDGVTRDLCERVDVSQ